MAFSRELVLVIAAQQEKNVADIVENYPDTPQVRQVCAEIRQKRLNILREGGLDNVLDKKR